MKAMNQNKEGSWFLVEEFPYQQCKDKRRDFYQFSETESYD
jgi:hypothetical protein